LTPESEQPRPVRRRFIVLLAGVLGFLLVAGILGSVLSKSHAQATTTTTSEQTTTSTTAPQESTTTTIPRVVTPPVNDVTFECLGNAPGANVSYGSDTSTSEAPGVPFAKTIPLDNSAEYYVVNGQLGGSGSIHCTVTVRWNQYGDNLSVSAAGSATGGYLIAHPQVCAGLDTGWQTC
jgi:hypothetical protein